MARDAAAWVDAWGTTVNVKPTEADQRACRSRRTPPSDRILASAKCLFFSLGYDAVSIDAVVKAAGVSKATVYARFQGKDHLLRCVIANECQVLSASECLGGLDALGVRRALTEIGTSYINTMISGGAISMLRLLSCRSVRLPESAQLLYDTVEGRFVHAAAECLERAVKSREINVSDTWLFATSFIGMVRGDLRTRALLGFDIHHHVDEARRSVGETVGLFMKSMK